VIARVTGGVADDSRSDVDDTGHDDAPEDQLSVVVTRFIVVDAGSGQYRGAVGHEPSRGVAPATAQFVDDHRPTLLVTCPVLSQQRCTGTIYTAWRARHLPRTLTAALHRYYIHRLACTKLNVAHTHDCQAYTVPQLIPVLGSQPARDGSHKPGGRLPLLSARPAVTLAALKRAATSFAGR